MALVRRLMEGRASPENPSTSLSNPANWLVEALGGGGKTQSGAKIDQRTALNLSAVWAAVRVLTDSVASLPLPVYERLEPRGKQRAPDHPVYRLLHDRPNPEMTAFTFREILQGHLATWGNAYAEKERNARGDVVNLWPITPNRVTVERRGGRKVYIIEVGNRKVVLGQDAVLHVPGFGYDGLVGYSPITMARESLGLAKATEQFGSMWFGNGSRVSGVLTHPGRLGDASERHLRESWEASHKGLDTAHRVAILEEGMGWQQVGIPPEDAQFLETRRFQTEEIARWFKVPPHMIQHLERSTFNNIEHQGIEFVTHTIRPWLVRWEQVLNFDLFTDDDAHFTEFVMDGLLRGDSQARSNFYQTGIRSGWLSINDIREKENENPVEGGDRYFVQRDMIPLDSVDELVASLNAPRGGMADRAEQRDVVPIAEAREARERRAVDGRIRLRRTHESLIEQVAESVVKREVDGVRAAVKKAFGGRDAARLRELVDEFYETHDEWVAERFAAVLLAYARNVAAEAAREVDGDVPDDLGDFMARYVSTLGRRWAGSGANQIRQLIADTPPEEVEEVVAGRLDEWEEKRAEKEATRESVEAGEAVTAFVYASAGVMVLKWRATGDSCPLCQKLNGRTVGVRDYFVREGDTVDPEDGETAPLTSKINVRHPPLHGGCDCAIVST